jgi:hypothetical protein
MSLTSFLSIPSVRSEFLNTFDFISPKLSAEMKAPPQTQNYSLVGTAFDYLLRFHIERLNPQSITRSWVAEDAVELTRVQPKIYEKLKMLLDRSKEEHELFLKNGTLSKGILVSSILLAKLDLIYRAGRLDPNLFTIDDGDIVDLKNLISITDFSVFKAKGVSALNPTFGDASLLVGGADADFIIDDTLIDLKTTKNLKLDRDYYNQLVGYYILSKLGGIDDLQDHAIKKFGIYFSRHGLLYTMPVSDIENNSNFSSFVKWFRNEAEITFKK